MAFPEVREITMDPKIFLVLAALAVIFGILAEMPDFEIHAEKDDWDAF